MSTTFYDKAKLACVGAGALVLMAGIAMAEDKSGMESLDLAAIIGSAAGKTDSVVRLPAGEFRVPGRTVVVRGARGLTIDGTGAKLVFNKAEDAAIRFENCDGVTLRGFTIDYDPLPYTQGSIVEKAPDSSWIEVEIHEGYPDLREEFDSRRVHFFDGKTRGWKRGAAEGVYRDLTRESPRKARVYLEPSMVQKGKAALLNPGDMAVFTMRKAPALQFFRSRNIRVEDVRIQASPGLAIDVRNADGDNQFLRCRVERGATPAGATEPRLLSTNCDALNYGYSRKGPLIEDCDFGFMGDDGINLHGPAFQVVRVESPNVVWCLRRTSLTRIREYYDNIILPGDPVRILDADNFAIKKTVPVTTLETDVTPPFQLSRDEIRKANSFANYPGEKYLKISLEDAAGVKPGDMIDFPAANSPGYVIRGNSIHDARPRGMRIMASDGVIENNRVARTTQPGISLGGHYAYYREAGWVRNVVVRNNILEDVGIGSDIDLALSPTPGAISVWSETAAVSGKNTPIAPGNQDIRITGNQIRGCSAEAIVVSGLTGGLIADNRISDCNQASPSIPLFGGTTPRGRDIVVVDSPGTQVRDNTFKNAEAKGIDSVFVSAQDSKDTQAPSSSLPIHESKETFLGSVRAFFARLLGR